MTAYVLYGLSFVNDWFNITENVMIRDGIDFLFDNQYGSLWTADNWWPIDSQSFNAFPYSRSKNNLYFFYRRPRLSNLR